MENPPPSRCSPKWGKYCPLCSARDAQLLTLLSGRGNSSSMRHVFNALESRAVTVGWGVIGEIPLCKDLKLNLSFPSLSVKVSFVSVHVILVHGYFLSISFLYLESWQHQDSAQLRVFLYMFEARKFVQSRQETPFLYQEYRRPKLVQRMGNMVLFLLVSI